MATATQTIPESGGSGVQVGADSLLWTGLCVVAAVLFAAVLRDKVFHTDDAYITYQYAKNIADGFGYVYHPDFAPLQGSSSPLHVAVLALLGAMLPVAVDEIGYWLSALGVGVANAAALTIAGRPIKGWPWMLALAGACATFQLVIMLAGGLEASWALAALLWLIRSVDSERWGWTAAWSAVLVLIRPDWGVFVAVAAGWMLLKGSWRTLLWLGIPAAALLGYFAASQLYFGLPVPFTWVAKAHIPEEVSGVLSWAAFVQGKPAVSLFVLLHVALAALGIGWRLGRGERARDSTLVVAASFAAMAILYTVILTLTGAPNQTWYFVAPLGMLFLCGCVALGAMASKRAALWGAAALVIAANYGAVVDVSRYYAYSWGGDMRGGGDRLEIIGRWLAANDPASADRDVVAFEVGKIAYFSGARVFDILGLVTEEGVEGMRSRDPGLLVRQIAPDYVIGCDCPDYLPMQFIASSEFRRQYRIIFSHEDYRVWRRQDL